MDLLQVEARLHFDLIKEELKSYLSSPYGRKYVDDLHFTTDEKLIRQRLKWISDLKSLLEKGLYFPTFQGEDLTFNVEKLNDPLSFWEGETFLIFLAHLDFLEEVKQLFQKNSITGILSGQELQKVPFHLKSHIIEIIDETGEVRNSASPELKQLRSEKANLIVTIEKKLYEILKIWKDRGIIEESVQPTIRKGRMVIPVQSHKKSLVRGVVHDVSTTGQTLFVEPQQVFQLNNQLQTLEGEERKEVVRILVKLTALVRDEKKAIDQMIELIGLLDFYMACATMAYHQRAVYPTISSDQKLLLKDARHPILEKVLLQKGRNIVPLNIAFDGSYRVMVLSGPNAGGKSVVLKTVGLLQYMLQCGLLVPCDEGSTFPLFHKILMDIGDNQSIVDDLSTFTWKLAAMKNIYEEANPFSLVLIDEIGSGTEPETGAVFAEAFLEKMLEKNAYMLVTTHYERLKNWASSHSETVNASMLFDNEKLEPTYELFMGVPGQSYALEIARKIEFPEEVLELAQSKLNMQQQESSSLLQQLIQMHRDLRDRQKQLEIAEEMVANLIKEYEALNARLQEKKEFILKQAEREAQRMLAETRKLIENTIREIRENALNKEKTKQIRKIFEEKKEKLLKLPQPELVREPLRPRKFVNEKKEESFKPGDKVRIKETQNVGEILEMNDGMVKVEVNGMILSLPVSDVEKYDKAISRYVRAVGFPAEQPAFSAVVDVRGMRVDEALQEIDKKIDQALLYGFPYLQIIHGKGYGILKKAIRDYLRQYKDILEFSFSQDEHEDGYTMVKFL